MATSNPHNMEALFNQLGLASDQQSIDQFVEKHHLKRFEHIEEASFWNSDQTAFIQKALTENSEWAELLDSLDAELHHYKELNAFRN